MKHQTMEQLERSAEVRIGNPMPLSYKERLERWAEALERDPRRRLGTLFETEHAHRPSRDRMRCDGSPLSVALEDPVLRAEGLDDDSYGSCRRFFNLSDTEIHRITCYCLNGSKISAETAARLIRSTRTFHGPGLLTRVFHRVRNGFAAA